MRSSSPLYLIRLSTIQTDREGIETWKDYLRFHLIEHYAGALPKVVAAEDFAFYETALSGAQRAPDRHQVAIKATNGAMGQAVGRLYTRQYFPSAAKAKAKAMVSDLISAYRARISKLTWMSCDQGKGFSQAGRVDDWCRVPR